MFVNVVTLLEHKGGKDLLFMKAKGGIFGHKITERVLDYSNQITSSIGRCTLKFIKLRDPSGLNDSLPEGVILALQPKILQPSLCFQSQVFWTQKKHVHFQQEMRTHL